MLPPFVTLEEHFFSDAALAAGTDAYAEQLKHIPGLLDKLSDVGPLRLQSMDANNVALQIVSHAPGPLSPAQCRSANDQLARHIGANPDRFAGFAVLPVNDPGECAAELERCVATHGFVGALIDNHTATGGFYDGPAYLPLWSAAASLSVPIYLHPTWPTPALCDALYANTSGDSGDSEHTLSAAAVTSIGSSAFGWHATTAIHILRLFAAGLFDRLPTLKLIVGHMGEMLPFMLARVHALSARWGPRTRDFRTVYDHNLWITTSGNWSVDPMGTILRNTRVERVLYSVDYPFGSNEQGMAFMRDLADSGMVDDEQLADIAYRNAERLLGVRVKKTFG